MQPGIDVMGFVTASSGLGEAGRLLVTALRSTEYPVAAVPVFTSTAKNDHEFEVSREFTYDKLMFAVNANELPMIMNQLPGQFVQKKYLMGQWFWELEYFPPSMRFGFQLVNEVWAPTGFICDALVKAAPPKVKIQKMPLPLVAPKFDPEISKVDIGVDPGRFMFYYTFSYFSVNGRKNPEAVVNAFKKAFKNEEGPTLVIKTVYGDKFPDKFKSLKTLVGDRTDIKLINSTLDSMTANALLNIADCYVSLHRSEGLGLTLSESMALGKPVIATNYSGNTEFMTDDTSILIPWEYTEVGIGNDVYPPTAKWAEPDVNAASEAMKHVYEHQNEAKLMGIRAKKHLEANFSIEKTGKAMADYLDSL